MPERERSPSGIFRWWGQRAALSALEFGAVAPADAAARGPYQGAAVYKPPLFLVGGVESAAP